MTQPTHKVFDSVIVITDRRVLDQQLQNTIYQFEHKTGRGRENRREHPAARQGAGRRGPIIISTIQNSLSSTGEGRGDAAPPASASP